MSEGFGELGAKRSIIEQIVPHEQRFDCRKRRNDSALGFSADVRNGGGFSISPDAVVRTQGNQYVVSDMLCSSCYAKRSKQRHIESRNLKLRSEHGVTT